MLDVISLAHKNDIKVKLNNKLHRGVRLIFMGCIHLMKIPVCQDGKVIKSMCLIENVN